MAPVSGFNGDRPRDGDPRAVTRPMRERDVRDWNALDAAYALAKDNGLPFRLHVLVWGNQQPERIASLPAEEQLAEIDE